MSIRSGVAATLTAASPLEDKDRWRLHLDVDDDPVWFCPDRDAHEFGDG
jgi:hypothetical protein